MDTAIGPIIHTAPMDMVDTTEDTTDMEEVSLIHTVLANGARWYSPSH